MENFDIKDVISAYFYNKVKKDINEETLKYYYEILKDKDFNLKDLNIWLNENFIIRIKKKKVKVEDKNDTLKLNIKDLLIEKYKFYFEKEIEKETLIYYYEILKPKDYSIKDLNKFIDIEFSNNKKNRLKILEKKNKERERKERKNLRNKEKEVLFENKIFPKNVVNKKIKKKKIKKKIEDVKCRIFLLLPIYNNGENCIDTIKNILNQKFKDWRMLVINCSNDYNDNLFLDYFMKKNYDNIEYIKNSNELVENLNYGINAFINSDCNFFIRLRDNYVYNDNFLEDMNNNKSLFTYSFWKDDLITKVTRYNKFNDLMNWSNIGVYMINKEILKIIKFKNIKFFEDYDLIFRIYLLLKTNEINCCEKFLVENILHDNNYVSLDNKIKLKKNKNIITRFYNFIYNNNINIKRLTLFNYYKTKLDFNIKSYILKLPPDYHILNN